MEDVDTRKLFRDMEEGDADAMLQGSLKGLAKLKAATNSKKKSSTGQTEPATTTAVGARVVRKRKEGATDDGVVIDGGNGD